MSEPLVELSLQQSRRVQSLKMTAGEILVAEVLVETHPVLHNRILVAGIDAAGDSFEQWLSHVAGIVVCAKDKVILQCPANHDQPVVTAVLESSRSKPSKAKIVSEALKLEQDEMLRISDHNGVPLLDVYSGESGTVLELHHELAELDVEGAFKINADSLELNARQGEMKLAASGDIKVDGEMIKLN